MTQELPVNNTIYVNNLNEKIKMDVLKNELNAIFQQFGDIIDVVARKSLSHKGQAFIIFRDIISAVNALKSMQGFPYHNKPMRVQFAKTDSDAIAKIKGTFVERPKKIRVTTKKIKKDLKAPAIKDKSVKEKIQANKAPKEEVQPAQRQAIQTPNQPHYILFITELPEEIDVNALSMLFGQFPGFKEVRMAPRPGIAFVEYVSEFTASHAKKALNGFNITPDRAIKVAYANRD